MQASNKTSEDSTSSLITDLTDPRFVLPPSFAAQSDKSKKEALQQSYYNCLDSPNLGKLITNFCHYLLERYLNR